ncbi:MAG: TrbG/VirB9 family P-type conjugative transfer protein [Bdellovibrionaceae bacterium]|nr:TrbG/VirB9 family P-type conjugative transfer protein [Pseudobdellovibrionaceae bacterium]
MRKAVITFLVMHLLSTASFAQIRKMSAKEDDILNVKTALGIATIVQLPDTIQSAIIGDQSGFKIEYLDKAVTIKPLRWGAKTNLYLVTEKKRFNVRLITGAQDIADYIVYVRNPEAPKSSVKWKTFGKSSTLNDLKLTVARVGISSGGFILLDVKLANLATKDILLKPSDIWIKQAGASKVINSLFISDLRLTKTLPLRIGISLAKSDLISGKPISLEIKKDKSIAVTISEDVLWR